MKLEAGPRREFIVTVGTATLTTITGCAGDSGDSEKTPTESPTATPADTPTETATPTPEQELDVPRENVIYAFAPTTIGIIDPDPGELVNEISDGFDDVDWGDVLPSQDNRRLFVNDGSRAQVIIIDTEQQAVEQRVEVGPGPTHMYHPRDNELWTHADDEGAFYIVTIDDLSVVDKVVAALDESGHGKLAYHEELGSTGYATNTNDPGIHVVDLEAREVTGFIETHEDGGTHAKRYNPVSGHVYIEGTTDARTAVVDTEDNTVIDHYDIVGHIYNTPGNEYVVWVNEEHGVHVLDAEQGEFVAEIAVEGAPDKIFFHEEGGTVYGFTANTQNSKAAVINFDQLDVIDEVEVGDILRPEGARFLHRGGLTADGWFVTPTSEDGVVSIVDASARELHAKVEVTEGVDTVGYVGSFQ